MPRTKRRTDPTYRLRELMIESGRSVRDIAAEAGTDHTVLLRMTNPPVNLVERILVALGKSWSDLE